MRFLTSPARLLVFATLFHFASTLGINCRGAAYCVGGQAGTRHGQVAHRLTSAIEGIDPNRWYPNGEQVACVTNKPNDGPLSYCAFLKNTGGALGSRILELAHYIEGHGCRGCGSVPFYYPEQNDVSGGELTYNYVRKPCVPGNGLCSVTMANTASSGFKISRFSSSIVSIFIFLHLHLI